MEIGDLAVLSYKAPAQQIRDSKVQYLVDRRVFPGLLVIALYP